ncbi:MAG: thioredoxin [Oscillospiraceae bacterium]|nr:thioredoxin [Oscillospiraceae bacterium]MCD8066052.1 thioredoxin [Oscillospiraceae bacterium]MCD8374563.1 thioredoxin [Oscillospiraceae bacterium]
MLEITRDNYDAEVKNSAVPVLLDFWASWCAPCRMLSPIVDELSAERGDIRFGKVNVDEQPALASAFGISSIPTLVLVSGDKIIAQSVGYCQKPELCAMIDGALAKQ